MSAPSRQFSVVGYAGADSVVLKAVKNPIDPVRVDVADGRFLNVDADGYLHFGIEVSGRLDGNTEPSVAQLDNTWRIESLALEVTGREAAPAK